MQALEKLHGARQQEQLRAASRQRGPAAGRGERVGRPGGWRRGWAGKLEERGVGALGGGVAEEPLRRASCEPLWRLLLSPPYPLRPVFRPLPLLRRQRENVRAPLRRLPLQLSWSAF